ncbi:MAG: hypothetical protein OXF08_00870 [Bacteroidetes bacterium]|nr:hypothetical protein [Bacteroidota bacterium]
MQNYIKTFNSASIDLQLSIDTILIKDIELDLKSRSPIVAFLYGLRQLLMNESAVYELKLLLDKYNTGVSKRHGRPGMSLWIVILLAAVKQELRCSDDNLAFYANSLLPLRLMMGHSLKDKTRYTRQALHANISSLDSELLKALNRLIVKFGHQEVGHQDEVVLNTHADSKVCLTNVEYPTDLRLLWNSCTSLIACCVSFAYAFGLTGWRQHKSIKQKLEKLYKHSCKRRRTAYRLNKVMRYLKYSNWVGEKAKEMLGALTAQKEEIMARLEGSTPSSADRILLEQIEEATQKICLYLDYIALFSDQIIRRVINNETIPTQEKIYSIYKPFTRWIVKGKAGVMCELGVPVAVVEDSYQFVLGYCIEWKGGDIDIAVSLVKDIEEQYPHLKMTCSFDLGFYSPEVRRQLETETRLETVGMSQRGRLPKKEKARQNTQEYKDAREGHSRIESCMNVLNHRGMRLIREASEEGFERAVACTIITVNLHRLGTLIQARELKRLRRKEKQRKRLRLAA